VATLAGLLQQAGYRTAAFVSAAVLDSRHGLDRGFQIYDDLLPTRGERPAADTVDRALAWWQRPDTGPAFLWVHLFDPHAPYRPPGPWADRYRERPYEGEIAYADHHLGRLLAAAGRRGALVSVIGDHGEGLGDHKEQEHGLLLYQTTLSVPWVLAGPGLTSGRVAGPVRTLDLLPTLLARLGLAAPGGLPGRDALTGSGPGGEEPTTAYAETLMPWEDYGWRPLFSLRRGHLKLMDGAYASLFDLAADPGEERDLLSPGGPDPDDPVQRQAALMAEDLAAIRKDAGGGLQSGGPAAGEDAATAPGPDRAERLRSLGYLGGGGRTGPPGALDPRGQADFHDRVRSALAAYRDRDFSGAAGVLRGLLAEQPGNPFLQDLAGSVELARGRPGEAAEMFAAALSRTPDRGPVEVRLAEALLAAGRAEAAAGRAAAALGHLPEPPPPRAVLVLCRALTAADRKDEATAAAASYLAKRERLATALGSVEEDPGTGSLLAELSELARASTP
jgi:hypothetical protein